MSSTAVIAQLGERKTEDLKVSGSIPDCGKFCLGEYTFHFSPLLTPTSKKDLIDRALSLRDLISCHYTVDFIVISDLATICSMAVILYLLPQLLTKWEQLEVCVCPRIRYFLTDTRNFSSVENFVCELKSLESVLRLVVLYVFLYSFSMINRSREIHEDEDI